MTSSLIPSFVDPPTSPAATEDSQSTISGSASSDVADICHIRDSDSSGIHVRQGGTIANFSPRYAPRYAPHSAAYEGGISDVADVLDSDSDSSDVHIRQGRTVVYWASRTPAEINCVVRRMWEIVLRPPNKRRFPVFPPAGSRLLLQIRGVRRWLKQYPRQTHTPPGTPFFITPSLEPGQMMNDGEVVERIVRMAAHRVITWEHDWSQHKILRRRIGASHIRF